jgi:hypothetical protein
VQLQYGRSVGIAAMQLGLLLLAIQVLIWFPHLRPSTIRKERKHARCSTFRYRANHAPGLHWSFSCGSRRRRIRCEPRKTAGHASPTRPESLTRLNDRRAGPIGHSSKGGDGAAWQSRRAS